MTPSLERQSFLVLPGFVSQNRAADLSKEVLATARDHDNQVAGAESVYNSPRLLELLCEKTPEVSAACGEPVLPTYTYARAYHGGNVLDRHKDRPACEISLTVNLGCDEVWPIWIAPPDNEAGVSVNLHPGDAMMYLGTVADHWREPFAGEWCTQVFLHYVRSRGPCAWAYFDKVQVKFLELF
jgi:hypothetical protein